MAVQKKSGTVKDTVVENVKARFFEMAGWGTTKEDLAKEVAEVDRKIEEHRRAISVLAATKETFGDRDKAVVATIIAAKGLFGDDEDKILAAVKLKYNVKKAKSRIKVDPALIKKIHSVLTSEPETIAVIMSRLPKGTERTVVSKVLLKLIADGHAVTTGTGRSKSYYVAADEEEEEEDSEEEEEDDSEEVDDVDEDEGEEDEEDEDEDEDEE